MSRTSLFFGFLAGFVLVPVITYWSLYSGLVKSDEHVTQSYAQVQNVMQVQADKIPNLVETVKGYAAHESKTLTQVIEARSKMASVLRIDPKELAANPELQKHLIEAQAAGQQALVNLNALRESYPQLKADALFVNLMAEISGAQNRIGVERRRAQLATQEYNMKTRTPISGFIARNHGFTPKPYFEASANAQTTPTVKF